MIDVNSMHSYLEAAKTCRKRCRQTKRSCLQWRKHHVELLPSAAAQPRPRQIVRVCIHFQQNFSLEAPRGCGAEAARVCHPASLKDWEASPRFLFRIKVNRFVQLALNTHCQRR